MASVDIRRVYVWELPVRFYHMVNAVAVLVLIVTGYLIGAPLAIQQGREASFSYWFGWVRFFHFVFAFVFFFNFVVRIYWGFVGNRWARWSEFLPFRKDQLREAKEVLKADILHVRSPRIESVGHNPIAGFTYFLSFLAFLFQCVTGFGLYAAMSHAWLPSLFKWIVPMMGGDFAVRQWHHVMTWFFVVFSMIHVYLVSYHDWLEGRGVMSSMVGGWKFLERPAPKP